jgi:hypothetical protein
LCPSPGSQDVGQYIVTNAEDFLASDMDSPV